MDIFVGSLPFKIKEKELQEIFEKYGTVSSVKLVINKATRQNKGYGFVVMPEDEQALEAIKSLHKTEVMGRTIVVSISDEKDEKQSGAASSSSDNKSTLRKNSFDWKKKSVKKKENIITFGDNDKESGYSNERAPRAKKAKNFKVGARKKK